ncbi:MAG: Fur family transcriptional regulator [Mucilaginibacter sp.]|jgi:Fur family ferric uptake transcriptional regulator|nr:Fur family transcriptional regulator [Mucilaginibacter sp.]
MSKSRNNNFEELLERHHLKKTGPRLKVLSMLSAKNVATSQPDLERVMSDIDRVTLYRILNTFEEKGIIHKVFDLNGTSNFAMCTSACEENHHHDEHLHFNCTNCKNVYCLDDLHLPHIDLPNGFKPEGFTLYATGLCPKCSKATEKTKLKQIV